MARPATASIGAAPTPSQTYYLTISEVASFLRVSRETIHRWLDPRSGLIQCPNGRTLGSVRFGERRLISAAAWREFVEADAPLAARSTEAAPSVANVKRRGRPRKAVAGGGRS